MITEGISTAAFASGVGLPIGIALGVTSVASSSSLGTPITQKISKTLTVKQEKHNSFKLLA